MPIQRDYRTIKNPKLTCREVLSYINNSKQMFNSKNIEDEFKIPLAEACTKIAFLRRWGCIKIFEKGKPRIYVITDWGKKMADKWSKNDKTKSKGI